MITGVHVLRYELPFRAPVRVGDGLHETRSGLLLGLVDDSGTTGWGEAAPLPGWSVEGLPQAEAGLLGLAGSIRDRPRGPEGLRPTASAWRLRLPSAAAALDTALLDLEAKRAGESLARHLSAGSDPLAAVPVNALIDGDTSSYVAEAAARARRQGFRAFKLKLGGRSVEEEARRVSALREAVGPNATLRLDAGGRWDPAEAIAVLGALVPYSIEYVEDPVADVDAFVQVGAAVEIPLAVDAYVARSADPLALVSATVADVVVLKPGALGGPRLAVALAAGAVEAGKRVVVTSFLESAIGLAAAVHVAAALPGPAAAAGLATSYLFAENVAEPPPIVDGAIVVPAGPGLGVAPSQIGAPDLAQGGTG